MSAPKKNRTGNIVQTSVLIHYLTKFSGFVCRLFFSGFFGWILTCYETLSDKFSSSLFVRKVKTSSHHKVFHLARKLKRWTASIYEKSFFLNLIKKLFGKLLTVKMNALGCFFCAYGCCLFLVRWFTIYSERGDAILLSEFVWEGVCILIGFLMLLSKKSLANAVYESHFLYWILFDCLGFPTIFWSEAARREVKSNLSAPLILAFLLGFMSAFLKPLWVFIGMILAILLFAVFSSPESGVVAVFFMLPFMSTVQLGIFLCVIFFSCFLKWICGRRPIHLCLLDVGAVGFLAFLFFGGIVTVDPSSAEKMLLMVCFMGMYFIVRNMISSPAMVKRCVYALIGSSLIVSVYGIYQNYAGLLSTKWQDMEVFFRIKGRAVSVFENPNVLGEFLILVFPITLAMMMISKKLHERCFLFTAVVLQCWCLIFTWSRGAWIGCIAATVLFLFVSKKDFFAKGVIALPWIGVFLYWKKDSLILTRLTGFGDSSTSYRLDIWRGTLRMLKDFGLHGIGIGEGAFEKIYPLYALAGTEAAPHTHNLYLQIAVEMGMFALLIFFAFIFLYAQFSFSFYKSAMSRSNKMIGLGIFCGVLAVLIQGLTDYIWYNYRIFLLFWMLIGLGAAHVCTAKNTEEEMNNIYF